MKFTPEAEALIDLSINEDFQDADHSAMSSIPETAKGKAELLIKEDGVLAGVEVAKKVFFKIDPSLLTRVLLPDGHNVKNGQVALTIEGNVHKILQAERLVLNFMQRMSGIATETKKYVDAVSGTGTKILDTRKTTPGLRFFEKWAVKTGGGENHRMGLYDMIMLKDNHIDFSGNVEKALGRAKEYLEKNQLDLPIEIETRNLHEVEQVLSTGIGECIMLDNFTVEETAEAVRLIDHRYKVESSGGITLDSVRDYAECGVDYISVGALTHKINSLDMSLKADFGGF